MDLDALFESFTNKTIMTIGDVMVDAYLFGSVQRISPEAPVPIVSVTSRENRLGGAANVALNLRSLGVTPILCSIIGDDEKGNIFMSLMENAGLSSEGIMQSQTRKTTTKTRIISGTQHTLRVDEEITVPIDGELEDKLLDKVSILFATKTVDAIIFEDYDKGMLTDRVIKEIVKMANERAIPTLVDPKKRNFYSYNGVSLFKPNFKELTDGMKLEVAAGDYDAIAGACRNFQDEHDIMYLMVTLSERGVLLSSKNSYYHLPAKIRQISDVSGAGDTVVSVAAACLSAGIEPDKIANYSNIAGGLVCEQSGVVPIDKEQLIAEIKKHL